MSKFRSISLPQPELHTKLYLLQELHPPDSDSPGQDIVAGTAQLLDGFPALREAVNGVFTALAYSESAEVLTPVINWSTLPLARTARERNLIIKEIQTRFREKLPPPILILNGAASLSRSPLPDFIFWNDNALTPFQRSSHLPSPPSWRGSQPPPPTWLDLPIANYGIHTRNIDQPESSAPMRYIALSYELVDMFAAACSACDRQNMSLEDHAAARQSLEAATASIKATVIHEIAHLWVSEQGKSSPSRTNVRGAEHPSFDIAEDEDNPGRIEAGLLVEKCWLGSPHELALNNAGWLTLALRNSRAVDVPDVLVPPSSPSDSEEDDASSLMAGLSTFRLGSPIHLAERRSPSPMSPTSPINADLPSLCESLWVCNPSLVAQFMVKNLLPYSPGQLEDGAGWVLLPRVSCRAITVYSSHHLATQQGIVEANTTIVPAIGAGVSSGPLYQ
ncbi:hypothetical protein B0H13DRAFT_1879136 [Mycena leptocephala]|nr:hypothetical protein B0H13DRAFT_1879136 [Mycena leptocephala]